jgi:hypothetical protein
MKAARDGMKQELQQVKSGDCDDLVNDLSEVISETDAAGDILAGSIAGEEISEGDVETELGIGAYDQFGGPIMPPGMPGGTIPGYPGPPMARLAQ